MVAKAKTTSRTPNNMQKLRSLRVHIAVFLVGLFIIWWGASAAHYAVKVSADNNVYADDWKVAVVCITFGGMLLGGVVANVAQLMRTWKSGSNG